VGWISLVPNAQKKYGRRGKEVRKVHYVIPCKPEFYNLTLHDAKMIIKYGRMAVKIEKQIARKRRYAEYMKKKGWS
jgi:hypothetical protein